MNTSPNQETALASELLEIASEAEIDRLLPLLIRPALRGLNPVAAMVLRAAAPVLKKATVQAIPAIRSASVKKRPRVTSAGVARGDGFGFGSAVSTRDARLWGTGFQRSRPREIQMAMSLRFVQAARRAARRAAIAALRHIRRGRPVRYEALRRVIYRALVSAVRERAPFLLPTMSAVSASLRQGLASTGSTLPQVRGGRLTGAPMSHRVRQRPGYTGATLPMPRGTSLGELDFPSPTGTHCRACQHERLNAGT
jgi:hypothetical protein